MEIRTRSFQELFLNLGFHAWEKNSEMCLPFFQLTWHTYMFMKIHIWYFWHFSKRCMSQNYGRYLNGWVFLFWRDLDLRKARWFLQMCSSTQEVTELSQGYLFFPSRWWWTFEPVGLLNLVVVIYDHLLLIMIVSIFINMFMNLF